MFTLTFLTRPRPDTSQAVFLERYRGRHFTLGSALPGLISYQQSLLTNSSTWQVPDENNVHVALSIYTFPSAEMAEDAFASPAGIALNEDTGTFMDWESVSAFPANVTQTFVARNASNTGELND